MKINWLPKMIALADLHPATYNPRKQNNKGKKSFIKNSEEWGNLEPIVVNFDGTIIGGHQRYFIEIEKGSEEMEVFQCDRLLTLDDEKELNIILNSVTGRTVLEKLIEGKLTQEELDELGFREFKMPVIKLPDTAIVEQGKEKNPSVLAMFFEVDDITEVKRVLKNIIRDVEEVTGVADAILYLEQYA